jgi:hypothetical protein
MWSAPLRDMYSGDYHFKDNSSQPRWGDVFMNLFQQDHPATPGTARADMLTATFGEAGLKLPLGTAFNLKVTATGATRDSMWRFPQPENSYQGISLPDRGRKDRFITEEMTAATGTTFNLPVAGGSLGGTKNMIQVVNPYLAYLDVSKFLAGNSNTGDLAKGYLIWDGRVEDGFTAVKVGDSDYLSGMRYLYTGPTPLTPGFIPPLQSFFVSRSAGRDVTSVIMSPEWTETKPPGSPATGYQLRSAETAEEGILRIRASQGSRTSHAALQFDRNASPEYNGREDVRALFYDEIPLTVYALTALGEPLAIHANGDFQSQTTGLGLRVGNAGEVTLTFSGMERFGHDVYLLDREKNLTVDLRETPEYTFTANKPPSVAAIEINDRFVLQMHYTGTGVWNEPAEVRTEALTVTSLNGEIHVRSTGGVIRELQVYGITGALIYVATTPATEYRIPAEHGGAYVVRAKIGETTETKIVIGD